MWPRLLAQQTCWTEAPARPAPERAAGRTVLALGALGAVVLLAAGCGAVARVTSGNPATGKTLFVAKCGSCHTLANAKTQGTIGPNLDDAFNSVKQQGFHVSTIVERRARPDRLPRRAAGHLLHEDVPRRRPARDSAAPRRRA